jgi:cyclin B
MRTILVDWLVEVHYKFRLHGASLWLTVNLLDRYLQRTSIPRERLQLVGVASLLIASKFDEVSPPEVTECVNITDNSYTKRELLNMEYNILETLSFQICIPTGFNFMNRYLSLVNADDITRNLAFFYAERNLQEQHVLAMTPTTLVSAALFAALWQRASTARGPNDAPLTPVSVWPEVLVRETEFSGDSLVTLARALVANVAMEPVTTSQRRLVAARKKYTQEIYLNVAALPLPSIPEREDAQTSVLAGNLAPAA